MRARTRPLPPVRPRASRRGGSILVVVLVTLLFAATALTFFIEKASDDLLVESRVAAARRLRLDAYSALETTLAVLQDFQLVNGGLHSPAEGWGNPLEWAGYVPAEGRAITVEFVDESGKLSLPRLTPNTLVELFKSWAIAPDDAEKLADALLQWMNPDYVPTSGFQPDYENDPLPYVAPARPLRSFSELAAIDVVRETFFDKDGRPNAYWKRFTEAVSLIDFTQSNLNSLRPGVLAAYGFDGNQQAQLGDFLAGTGNYQTQGPGYFHTPAEAATILGAEAPAGIGTSIGALRIIVTVLDSQSARSGFRLNVVVAPPGSTARVVDQIATAKRPNTVVESPVSPTAAPTPANPGNAAAGAGASAQNPAPSLNYPFTILEIRENDEMPQTPADPTADSSANPPVKA
jgi:general secretion pathway protein K